MSENKTPKQIVHRTIKKLDVTDLDDAFIAEEVEAIFEALNRNGFIVVHVTDRSRSSAALKG